MAHKTSAMFDQCNDFTIHDGTFNQTIVNPPPELPQDWPLKTKLREMLGRLKCAPARFNAANTPDTCAPGTRLEVIHDILRRLTTGDPSERIVMLSGSAGTGKSTIAKSVALELDNRRLLAASFFFSRHHAPRNEIALVPTTIARQLADFSPFFQHRLVDILTEDKTEILSARPQEQFEKLVVRLLAEAPYSPDMATPWVICLDALDECGAVDRGQEFLRLLSVNINNIPAHIRFFLTGRPDVPSYLKFRSLQSQVSSISLDEIDSVQDIGTYLEWALDGSNTTVWPTPRPWSAHAQDIDEITGRADGLFIFAATVVRYIVPQGADDDPQESLEYLLYRGAPLLDLESLYNRILDDAIPLPGGRDPRQRDRHDRALVVLGTVLNLLEPLEAPALAALLNMKTGDLRRTLLPLSAVIRLPDDDITGIRVLHLSFREFMVGPIKDIREDLLCGTEPQKVSIAMNLFRVMRTELRFNICQLPTSFLRNIEFSDLENRLEEHVSVHLRYSCKFWAEHVQATAYNSTLLQATARFLFNHFLFWLEVLSLLGLVGSAPPALSTLLIWASNMDAEIVAFARDAKRFISFFAHAITQSAPHIYLSALAFSPIESEIGKRFRSHFPRLLSIPEDFMRTWPGLIATLEADAGGVTALACSSDGNWVASGYNDGSVRLWDVERGQIIDLPKKATGEAVKCLALAPNGLFIAVPSQRDEIVFLWDCMRGEVQNIPTPNITCVTFSQSASHIIYGSSEGILHVRDLQGQELTAYVPSNYSRSTRFRDFCFSVSLVECSARYIAATSFETI